MKAVLKRTLTPDQNLQFIQDATQSALDQSTKYSPSAPANWAGTAPATVHDAIDRIAALLVTLNGGNAIP